VSILDALAPLALALTAVGIPALISYRAGLNRGAARALANAERVRRTHGGDR
jgi:hypothetical protein